MLSGYFRNAVRMLPETVSGCGRNMHIDTRVLPLSTKFVVEPTYALPPILCLYILQSYPLGMNIYLNNIYSYSVPYTNDHSSHCHARLIWQKDVA